MSDLLYSEDIDTRLSWPLGRAERLARRGQLPHIVLPDGSIRFEWPQIEALIRRVPRRIETAGANHAQ
jgi:hypothetical protein